jgi:hypothetical protein
MEERQGPNWGCSAKGKKHVHELYVYYYTPLIFSVKFRDLNTDCSFINLLRSIQILPYRHL